MRELRVEDFDGFSGKINMAYEHGVSLFAYINIGETGKISYCVRDVLLPDDIWYYTDLSEAIAMYNRLIGVGMPVPREENNG